MISTSSGILAQSTAISENLPNELTRTAHVVEIERHPLVVGDMPNRAQVNRNRNNDSL